MNEVSDQERATDLANRIGSNTLALTLSYGLNTLLSGIVAIFLVRYLGREEYGLLSTTYAYLSFFIIFTTVGLDTIVQREAARTPEKAGEIVTGVFGLRLLLSAGAMVLSWVLMFTADPSPRLVGLILLVSFSFLFNVSSLLLIPFIVQLRMGLPKLLLGVWSLLLSAAKLGLIVAGAPLEAFAAMELVSGAGSLVISWALARRVRFRVALSFKTGPWRRFLRESLPVALAQCLIQVYLRIDHVMLYRLVGPEEVGLYGASTRLVEFANVIPIVFMGSLFPILSRLHEENPETLRKATSVSFRAMAGVGVPLAAFLFLYAYPVLLALFGSDFTGGAPILRLLSWSLPFVFLNSVLYNRLFTSGDQNAAAVVAFLAALVNVILNLLLIPRMGGEGAALATLISYAIVSVTALGPHESRGIASMAIRASSKPALGGGMALVAFHLLQLPWGVALFLLPFFYGLSMVLMREWGREELALVRKALGKR